MDIPPDRPPSDEPPLVLVQHLGKKYSRNLKRSLWYGLTDIGREFLLEGEHGPETVLRKNEFWAVNDISFELRRGEALALIGPNGAGKSTLLKMLSGLVKPDTGHIRVRGRTGALIELGAGFDPLLTGRENIHVSAAVLGLSRVEVEKLLPRIIAFSELEEFVDTPLKYYSSGMNARLSFAVASHLNPSVFLVDEVLAVGDIDFQRKCINHMLRYLAGGGALILVSHSPYLIQSVCTRGIFIHAGRVHYMGTAIDALNKYLENPLLKASRGHEISVPTEATTDVEPPQRAARELTEARPVSIDEVTIEGASGRTLTTGEEARITVRYRALGEREICWGFTIWTNDQWVCITGTADYTPHKISEGTHTLHCTLPKLPLLAGNYIFKMGILEAVSRQPLALFGWQDAPLSFQVQSPVTFLNNALKSINQLVTLDVIWDK